MMIVEAILGWLIYGVVSIIAGLVYAMWYVAALLYVMF